MVDMSAIAGMLSALNAAKNIAESMIGLRDSAAFQSKLIEFQSKILDAQNSAFAANDERSALIERVRELEEKVAKLETWEAEKKRYKLTEIGTGLTAYTLKEDMEAGEPKHQLCTNCYNEGHKSIMQIETRYPGMAQVLVCHRCGTDLYIHGQRHAEHTKTTKRR